MNTGIQDAHNLAWKIALAMNGAASSTLLHGYDAEHRQVGGGGARGHRRGTVAAAHENLVVYVIAAASKDVITDTNLPVLQDADDAFAAAYGVAETSVFVVRPDGYQRFRADHADAVSVVEYLKETFR